MPRASPVRNGATGNFRCFGELRKSPRDVEQTIGPGRAHDRLGLATKLDLELSVAERSFEAADGVRDRTSESATILKCDRNLDRLLVYARIGLHMYEPAQRCDLRIVNHLVGERTR